MKNFKLSDGHVGWPTVSVIIPIYNGEAYLGQAIRSVLTQTHRPREVIVVDDGSTDGSEKVVRRFASSVRYFYQLNSGTSAARNRGVQLAAGEFLAFLDQDDLWVQNKLTQQIKAFKSFQHLDMVFGQVRQFYSPRLDNWVKKRNSPDGFMPGYIPSAMLIRREAFFRVGAFKEHFRVGEWADWYVRATESGLRTMMLPNLVTLRRLHNTNKGILYRSEVAEYVQILKAFLDRNRAKQSRN